MVIFSLFSGGILVILGILMLLLFIGSRGRIVFSSAYYAPNNPKEPIKLVFTREPMGAVDWKRRCSGEDVMFCKRHCFARWNRLFYRPKQALLVYKRVVFIMRGGRCCNVLNISLLHNSYGCKKCLYMFLEVWNKDFEQQIRLSASAYHCFATILIRPSICCALSFVCSKLMCCCSIVSVCKGKIILLLWQILLEISV